MIYIALLISMVLGYFLGYFIRRSKSTELPHGMLTNSPYTIDKFYSTKYNKHRYRILKSDNILCINNVDYIGYDTLEEIQKEINELERIYNHKVTKWDY